MQPKVFLCCCYRMCSVNHNYKTFGDDQTTWICVTWNLSCQVVFVLLPIFETLFAVSWHLFKHDPVIWLLSVVWTSHMAYICWPPFGKIHFALNVLLQPPLPSKHSHKYVIITSKWRFDVIMYLLNSVFAGYLLMMMHYDIFVITDTQA